MFGYAVYILFISGPETLEESTFQYQKQQKTQEDLKQHLNISLKFKIVPKLMYRVYSIIVYTPC